MIIRYTSLFLFSLILFTAGKTQAQEDIDTADVEPPQPAKVRMVPFNLHFQATYVYQYKPEFTAAYTGNNSLKTIEEKENSLTATLAFGARLWRGGELYINPEVAGGSGLSGAFGVAAATNGETFRVGNPAPTLYLARGYVKQTFALGKAREKVEDNMNQLGGYEPASYLRFMAGKFSLGDIFDNVSYANSPRTQFLNWCLMNNGAWDYAANTRGYTYAFATILKMENTWYKVALAMLPKVANGPELNDKLGEAFSINGELGKSWGGKDNAGAVRLLVFHNYTNMGNYREATDHPNPFGGPDIVGTRASGRTKTGVCLSAEQQMTRFVGAFFRAGWNDGKNETWAFTEADRSFSAGINVNGGPWERKEDNLGVAVVVNGLSQEHRDYLEAGGLGFQLGDGKLSYSNELAAEAYYSLKPVKSGMWLSGDYQFVLNPGYNKDRGPAHVFSFRVHVEL